MEIQDLQKVEIKNELVIDINIKTCLLEARKWTKFLAILGFIGIGFMVLVGIIIALTGNLISEANPTYQDLPFHTSFLGLFYTILALVYFFPILYLLNFSNKLKYALIRNHQPSLYKAFNNLKIHFKFMGILSIIMFVLSIILIMTITIIGAVATIG